MQTLSHQSIEVLWGVLDPRVWLLLTVRTGEHRVTWIRHPEICILPFTKPTVKRGNDSHDTVSLQLNLRLTLFCSSEVIFLLSRSLLNQSLPR